MRRAPRPILEERIMGQGGETRLRDGLSQARWTFESSFEANALYEAAVKVHIVTTALFGLVLSSLGLWALTTNPGNQATRLG